MNKGTLYGFAKNVTPPIVFSAFIRNPLYPYFKKWISAFATRDSYTPSWNTIKSGPLKGKELFVDPNGDWQKEMLEGLYDDFFFDYAKNLDLKSKTVFDIGAHIGFSSLYFAERVGENGKVFTFEPNPWNIERIETILTKNEDLGKRITIVPKAVSNNSEETDFVFTDNVEGGTSSGSFISEASTLYDKTAYEEKGGFKRMKVPCISLDSFVTVETVPHLLKIDVEGGESLVLEGAQKTILEHHPLLLIEIHSIYNMFKVTSVLTGWNYDITLLKEEKDGRCFIAAHYVSEK